MPDLPQNLVVTQPNVFDGLRKAWVTLIQTVNALSRTDTVALRPTTPPLDHIFYTETDGEQRTYVGVNGAWQGIRPVLRVVATASLPAAAAAMNGTVLIEDVGAGDRNLIVYAGGERFRIDGGAAF